MVLMSNTWKLNPSCKCETSRLSGLDPIEELQKAIDRGGSFFTEERYHWVEEKILEKDEFLAEKKAKEQLLKTLLLYARTIKTGKNEENYYYFVLSELLKKMNDELDIATNKLFAFERNGKRLTKRGGESMEHYLMRVIILQYLDEKYSVKDFHEEYSKLREVLKEFLNGKGNEKEWEKIAKRADLYVILQDGTKLWIEVDRTRNSRALNKKLSRIKTVLSLYPDLVDKVTLVFSDFLNGAMIKGTLVEANGLGFPVDRLEFYEVNLREDRFRHAIKPSLIKAEFGDELLDMIADGSMNPSGKVAMMAKNLIYKEIIVRLVNNDFEQKWVIEKQGKLKRLIRFWRIRVGKFRQIIPNEIELKEKALKKIKTDYPILLT